MKTAIIFRDRDNSTLLIRPEMGHERLNPAAHNNNMMQNQVFLDENDEGHIHHDGAYIEVESLLCQTSPPSDNGHSSPL